MKYIIIKLWILCILTLLGILDSKAQFLSAEQAVAIALENNYAIRLSRLSEEVLENNVTLGNAGFLPEIDLSASQNNRITDSNNEFFSGVTEERENAKARSFNAGGNINYVFFDGLQMFSGYDILKTQLEAGQLRTRLEVETTVSEVLRLYYNIVELSQKVHMFETSVALGRARTNISDEKLSIGAGSRLELLQARVDMNSDISELLNLNDLLTEASISLNLLLARNAGEPIIVEDTIILMPPADFATLKSRMEAMNVNLLLNNNDVELAKLNLKNIKGRRLPELGANLGYSFNKQNSEYGVTKSSQTSGLNYGLTASMSIFNGFNQHREQQNARIGIESSNLQLESYLADLNAQLLSTFSVYSNKLKNLDLERENVETAQTNFSIANERYKLGELSGLEIREAQQNLLLAQDRLITLIYQARLLEIDLLHLSGSIIPQ